MFTKQRNIAIVLMILAVLTILWALGIIPHVFSASDIKTWGFIILLAIILYILSR